MSETTPKPIFLDKIFPSQETVDDIHAIHLCMERLAAETKLAFFGAIQICVPVHDDDGSIALQRYGSRVIQIEEPFGHFLYMRAFKVMVAHIANTAKDFPIGLLHHLLLDHVLGILKKEAGEKPLPVSRFDSFREFDYPDRPDPLTPSSSDDEIISHIKEVASGAPLSRALLKDIHDAIGRISKRSDACIFIQIHFVCGLDLNTVRIGDFGLALGMVKTLDILLLEQLHSCLKDFTQHPVPTMSLDDIQTFLSQVQLVEKKRATLSPRIRALCENLKVEAWEPVGATKEEVIEPNTP